MEKITEQLLEKIFYLQEELAEEKQYKITTGKEIKKYIDTIKYLEEERKRQERKNKDEEIRAFYIGIGLAIFLYLLIRFLLYFYF